MDGLLLDSERLARALFVKACAAYGWEPDLAGYARCIGTTHEATERILKDVHGPNFPYGQISRRWSELYETAVLHEAVPRKPGALALLRRLQTLGVPLALATSTARDITLAKLEHASLGGFFSQLVCGGETARGKPHPDPYLRAAAEIAPGGGECWAVEDSDNGVRAAHAAGLRVFQVPDLVAPTSDLRALGHVIVDSLYDVLGCLPR